MGCGSDKGFDSTTPLAVNTRVQLIAEEGEFALIETADAQQYYVDLRSFKNPIKFSFSTRSITHAHTQRTGPSISWQPA